MNNRSKAPVEILKKIANRQLGFDVATNKELVANAGKSVVPLYAVYGIVSRVSRGETNMGPYVALIGQVEATRYQDGQRFMSTQVFLPAPMDEAIAQRIEQGDNEAVSFAYEIGIKAAETAVGYEYTTKPLQDPQGNDQLSSLRALLPK